MSDTCAVLFAICRSKPSSLLREVDPKVKGSILYESAVPSEMVPPAESPAILLIVD